MVNANVNALNLSQIKFISNFRILHLDLHVHIKNVNIACHCHVGMVSCK